MSHRKLASTIPALRVLAETSLEQAQGGWGEFEYQMAAFERKTYALDAMMDGSYSWNPPSYVQSSNVGFDYEQATQQASLDRGYARNEAAAEQYWNEPGYW